MDTSRSRSSIAVITDSCADLPPQLAREMGIYIIPLQIIFSDRAFSDGVDITPDEVYQRLPQEVPKTSLPTGEAVLQVLKQVREDGYERAIIITFSSGLSGTFHFVEGIAAEFSGLETAAFDTLSGSLGTGAVALRTAQLAAAGRSWEALLETVPRLIANVRVFFCVNTLEYLKKGGRIGLISSIAGTMLQIKPVLTFAPDGQLTDLAKVRGRQQSLHKLAQLVLDVPLEDRRFLLMVAHGGTPADSAAVRDELLAALPQPETLIEGVIDCTLGTHVGPGLVGAGILPLDDGD